MRPVACALATALLAAACGGGSRPAPTGPRPAASTRSSPAPARRPAPVSEGFHVVQRDGVALWSRATAGGRYALVVRRVARRPHVVPVPPALWPFDADLGEDARGRPTALYSRCRAAGRQRSGYPGTRRACDLYALDLTTELERRLGRLSTGDASERSPALDRGTVVFVRVPEPERPGGAARLMRARLAGGQPRTIARLPAVTIADDVLGADFDRGRLALAVYRAPSVDPAHGEWVVLLDRGDGRLREIDAGGAGEEHADRRSSPTFAAGTLYWAAANDEPAGPPDARVHRLDLRTGAKAERPVEGYLLSVAADPVRRAAALLVSADDGAHDPSVEWYGTAIVRAIPRAGFS